MLILDVVSETFEFQIVQRGRQLEYVFGSHMRVDRCFCEIAFHQTKVRTYTVHGVERRAQRIRIDWIIALPVAFLEQCNLLGAYLCENNKFRKFESVPTTSLAPP